MKNSGYLPDAKRAKEKLSQCLSKVENHTPNKDVKALFLCSPSDEGVMRNLGRNGTKYGPKTILNHFSQLTKHNNNSFQYDNVTNQNDEINDFNNAQKSQSENIKNYIEQNIIHLGGGHDHVYPLLKAIETKYKKIIILNIDPHCDTRESEHNHSGTPFRQFLSETKAK
jgi:formiminoglutamase